MSASPLYTLRKMILHGELQPGERVTESGLAEQLGLSRTPIRNALPALASEGFLEKTGKRGFSVKQFSGEESIGALELRSDLEAIAARKLAENGISDEIIAKLEACLKEGDKLFEKRYVTNEDEEYYGEMNAKFHQTIVNNCGSDLLRSFIERLNLVPFIAPSAIVFDEVGLDHAFEILFRAHGQHHAITEAIRDGDGARVESLFKEHGNSQRESLFSRIAHSNKIKRAKKPT